MKLHLGCGRINIPGFYNIDLSDHEHVDLKADIRDLHMFENDTIYNNHNEVVNFLTYQCCAGRMNELYYHLIENY